MKPPPLAAVIWFGPIDSSDSLISELYYNSIKLENKRALAILISGKCIFQLLRAFFVFVFESNILAVPVARMYSGSRLIQHVHRIILTTVMGLKNVTVCLLLLFSICNILSEKLIDLWSF